MPEIIPKANSKALQVVIADNNKDAGLDSRTAKLVKFEAKYKQTYLDLSANRLYIGVKFSIGHKTTDPFARTQWYELGATISKSLSATNINELEIDSKVELKREELARLLLGIFQASWHYDSYLSDKAAKSKAY